MKKLLDICKKLWISILIILAIIVIIIEFYIIFWLIDFDGINKTIMTLSNLTLAIWAFFALTTWKNELKKKRQFDIVDELLVLIIKTQTFLKEDIAFYTVGSEDTEEKKGSVSRINRRAILYGKSFELVYSKLMTVGLKDFANKTKDLIPKFAYSVKNDNTSYTSFYEACLDENSNFRTKTIQELSELRIMCENKIFV